jgi:hypothetical protein
LSVSCIAQNDTSFTLLKKINGDINAFTADLLDNIYLHYSSGQLKKLDANGDSVAVFNNIRRYGKLSYMDVSNPLRVLLYYKDFSIVVILDRLLSVRTSIDLRKQDIFQVQAIGLSYDNNIWLYDEMESKLKKIDENGNLLYTSTDFRQLFDESYSFTSIFDQDGLLYLYDKNKGVLIFDYYGSFKSKIPLTGLNNFKVAGKYIFGIKNDSLIRYQPAVFMSQAIKLPLAFQQAITIHFTSTRAYALKKDELEVYQLR